MNTVYNNNLDKEKITGGIVGIWAKMSTDSILRNKLFEKGKVWCNTSERRLSKSSFVPGRFGVQVS